MALLLTNRPRDEPLIILTEPVLRDVKWQCWRRRNRLYGIVGPDQLLGNGEIPLPYHHWMSFVLR